MNDIKYTYFLTYDSLDMHYKVWETVNPPDGFQKKQAKELVMRFINKEQAINHYENLGIKLLDFRKNKDE